MKRRSVLLAVLIGMCQVLAGCQASEESEVRTESHTEDNTADAVANSPAIEGATQIILSDDEILVDGDVISADEKAAVYAANDIIFYLEGQGISYGEGTAKDEHFQKEADAHTVVHITEPGTYEISGTLSAGQILVDLGDDAKKDEEAVVTLALNNMNLSCNVCFSHAFVSASAKDASMVLQASCCSSVSVRAKVSIIC